MGWTPPPARASTCQSGSVSQPLEPRAASVPLLALQAFAAYPIGGFPQHRQCLDYGLVIHPVAQAHFGCRTEFPDQYADCVLAVIAGQGHELVEVLDPIAERRAAISQPQCLHQLLACRHADWRRHVARLPPDSPTGNKLREVTTVRLSAPRRPGARACAMSRPVSRPIRPSFTRWDFARQSNVRRWPTRTNRATDVSGRTSRPC